MKHRTAQRLRVSSPALQGQNKPQQKKAQELEPSDFEGSRFNRWLCQGSGQHPLAGSPQHQRAFVIATGRRPGEWPAACCSGALAVLFGSGQSPATGHHYRRQYQSRTWSSSDLVSGFGVGAWPGAGAGAWPGPSACVSWLICPSRNVIRSVALARSALNWSTNSLLARTSVPQARASVPLARAWPGAVSASSGMLITHWLPTLLPVSNPLVNLRLTVFGETPRAFAVSFIESCIPKRVTHVSYPNLVIMGKYLPNLLMLGKCRYG